MRTTRQTTIVTPQYHVRIDLDRLLSMGTAPSSKALRLSAFKGFAVAVPLGHIALGPHPFRAGFGQGVLFLSVFAIDLS